MVRAGSITRSDAQGSNIIFILLPAGLIQDEYEIYNALKGIVSHRIDFFYSRYRILQYQFLVWELVYYFPVGIYHGIFPVSPEDFRFEVASVTRLYCVVILSSNFRSNLHFISNIPIKFYT